MNYYLTLLLLPLLTPLTLALTHIVTGGSGYLGKAIIHELLSSADVSNSIIVSLVRPSRVAKEQCYWNHKSHDIKVCPYDMLDGGETLKSALCEYANDNNGSSVVVYHTASVFGPTSDHRQTALDNVKGTLDLVTTLQSCHQQHRLVLTSSMAAVRATSQLPKNGKFYTHLDWNDQSKLGESWGASYQWSKAESERVATRAYTDDNNNNNNSIVRICPSFIFGPPLDDSSTSYSLQLVKDWINGVSPVQSRLLVDIRDVAKAHVVAGQMKLSNNGNNNNNNSINRFIVSNESRVPSETLASWLEQAKSTFTANGSSISFDAEYKGGAIPIGQQEVEAVDRLRDELGIELTPARQTITDMADYLMNHASRAKT